MDLWAIWSNGSCPCPWTGVEQGGLSPSPTHSMILWLSQICIRPWCANTFDGNSLSDPNQQTHYCIKNTSRTQWKGKAHVIVWRNTCYYKDKEVFTCKITKVFQKRCNIAPHETIFLKATFHFIPHTFILETHMKQDCFFIAGISTTTSPVVCSGLIIKTWTLRQNINYPLCWWNMTQLSCAGYFE